MLTLSKVMAVEVVESRHVEHTVTVKSVGRVDQLTGHRKKKSGILGFGVSNWVNKRDIY